MKASSPSSFFGCKFTISGLGDFDSLPKTSPFRLLCLMAMLVASTVLKLTLSSCVLMW